MEESNKAQLLIDYLQVLAQLKNANYFANNEISRVIVKIEKELEIN